jgi:hypothetical protein
MSPSQPPPCPTWTTVSYKRGRSTQESTDQIAKHIKDDLHLSPPTITSNCYTSLANEDSEAPPTPAGRVHFYKPSLTLPIICWMYYYRLQINWAFFLLNISFRQLLVCNFVAPSLTRGRVCKLLYSCFWALPEQSLSGRSPSELTAIFNCLVWDSTNLEGQVPVFQSHVSAVRNFQCYHWEGCKVKVMLRLTVSQSVCLDVKFTLELVSRYYFLSESCCVVSLSDERSGLSPVSHCHQCLVHCQRFKIIYIVHVTSLSICKLY